LSLIVKSKVRSGFDHSARSYDGAARIQDETARELFFRVAALNIEQGSALDIGAGTGAISARLAGSGMFKTIAAVDISFAMSVVAKARLEKYPLSVVIQADAERLPVKEDSFDLVVSNLALQWMTDITTAFEEMRLALKQGGRAELNFLADGTFGEIKESAFAAMERAGKGVGPKLHPFPSVEAAHAAAEEAGFHIEMMETGSRVVNFGNVWELMRSLKKQGVQNSFALSSLGLGRRGVMTLFAEEYNRRFGTGGGIKATYIVARMSAVKK